MSALFVHQSPTLSQKIDSREGLFRCKKGVVEHAGKMNFYLKTRPIVPSFGLFAAKCSAFWCKTQGKMVQNTVKNAAKCETICINIR